MLMSIHALIYIYIYHYIRFLDVKQVIIQSTSPTSTFEDDAIRCLDHSITAHFRAWIATSAETWLRQRLAQGAAGPLWAVACDAVGWWLREVSLHHRAAALLQETEREREKSWKNYMECLEKVESSPLKVVIIYDYLCTNAGFSLFMSMYWREPHLCLVCKTSPTFRHATWYFKGLKNRKTKKNVSCMLHDLYWDWTYILPIYPSWNIGNSVGIGPWDPVAGCFAAGPLW